MGPVVQICQRLVSDVEVERLARGYLSLFIAWIEGYQNDDRFDGLAYLRKLKGREKRVFVTWVGVFVSDCILNGCPPSTPVDYHHNPFRTNKARELIAFAGILSGLVRTRTGQSGLWEKLDPLLKDSVEESLHKLGFFPFTDAMEEFMRFQYWRLGVRMGMRIAEDNLLSEQVNQDPDL